MFGQRKVAPTIALKEKLNAIKLQNWISKQKNIGF
jgi:hypothetical protein